MKKIGKSPKNDGLSWVSHHFPSIFPGPAARLAGAPPLPPRRRNAGGARRGVGGAVESARLGVADGCVGGLWGWWTTSGVRLFWCPSLGQWLAWLAGRIFSMFLMFLMFWMFLMFLCLDDSWWFWIFVGPVSNKITAFDAEASWFLPMLHSYILTSAKIILHYLESSRFFLLRVRKGQHTKKILTCLPEIIMYIILFILISYPPFFDKPKLWKFGTPVRGTKCCWPSLSIENAPHSKPGHK